MQLFQIEAGEREYGFMIEYAGLREDQTADKDAVNAAFERLLRRALAALLHQESGRRR